MILFIGIVRMTVVSRIHVLGFRMFVVTKAFCRTSRQCRYPEQQQQCCADAKHQSEAALSCTSHAIPSPKQCLIRHTLSTAPEPFLWYGQFIFLLYPSDLKTLNVLSRDK